MTVLTRYEWRCRSAPGSAPVIPSWLANAGSDEALRHPGGASETSEPESRHAMRIRDLVLRANPGMTTEKARRGCSGLPLQMPGEEGEAARPGNVGAGLVVTCALIAVEAVLGARIDMDLDLRPLGLNGLDVAERNAGVFFAEMELGRHCRLVVGKAQDSAAVIADRGRP